MVLAIQLTMKTIFWFLKQLTIKLPKNFNEIPYPFDASIIPIDKNPKTKFAQFDTKTKSISDIVFFWTLVESVNKGPLVLLCSIVYTISLL